MINRKVLFLSSIGLRQMPADLKGLIERMTGGQSRLTALEVHRYSLDISCIYPEINRLNESRQFTDIIVDDSFIDAPLGLKSAFNITPERWFLYREIEYCDQRRPALFQYKPDLKNIDNNPNM